MVNQRVQAIFICPEFTGIVKIPCYAMSIQAGNIPARTKGAFPLCLQNNLSDSRIIAPGQQGLFHRDAHIIAEGIQGLWTGKGYSASCFFYPADYLTHASYSLHIANR